MKKIRRLQKIWNSKRAGAGDRALETGELAKDCFLSKRLQGATLEDSRSLAVARRPPAGLPGCVPLRCAGNGGIVLHRGIAEMKTGEGKTLVAVMPAYLNALTGKGVHVITVNDYLARRDSEWMGPIFRLLGLEVGLIVHGLNREQRQRAYSADIVYGTNNEFGFDYLRDNMVLTKKAGSRNFTCHC